MILLLWLAFQTYIDVRVGAETARVQVLNAVTSQAAHGECFVVYKPGSILVSGDREACPPRDLTDPAMHIENFTSIQCSSNAMGWKQCRLVF